MERTGFVSPGVRGTALAAVCALLLAGAASRADARAPEGPSGRPDRVQIKSARTTGHRITVTWQPAQTGPRPTGYQFRVVGHRWRDADGNQAVIRHLEPQHTYEVKVRGVRNGTRGPAVTVHAMTHRAG